MSPDRPSAEDLSLHLLPPGDGPVVAHAPQGVILHHIALPEGGAGAACVEGLALCWKIFDTKEPQEYSQMIQQGEMVIWPPEAIIVYLVMLRLSAPYCLSTPVPPVPGEHNTYSGRGPGSCCRFRLGRHARGRTATRGGGPLRCRSRSRRSPAHAGQTGRQTARQPAS